MRSELMVGASRWELPLSQRRTGVHASAFEVLLKLVFSVQGVQMRSELDVGFVETKAPGSHVVQFVHADALAEAVNVLAPHAAHVRSVVGEARAAMNSPARQVLTGLHEGALGTAVNPWFSSQAAHARSLVAVGVAVTLNPAKHGRHGRHAGWFVLFWNVEPLQATHCRSLDSVGTADTALPGLQTVTLAHCS